MTHSAPAIRLRGVVAAFGVLALVAACGASAARAASVQTAAIGTPPGNCAEPPAVVAHRGGNEIYTENTLGAFSSAFTLADAKVWETDVRFDNNNVGVILHDSTVDRTTPSTGAISELQASGSVRIPTDDGQQIPTEWEVLNLAATMGARVLLELKVMPANATQWHNFWQRIDITVGRENITVASFDTATLAAVRAQDPAVRTALIHTWNYISAADVLAQGQSFEKYGPSYTISRFAEWHAAGIELFAWTLDDPIADQWNRLVSYPVDGVITDKPIAFRNWLTQQCPGAPQKDGLTPPGSDRPMIPAAEPTTAPTTTSPTAPTACPS